MIQLVYNAGAENKMLTLNILVYEELRNVGISMRNIHFWPESLHYKNFVVLQAAFECVWGKN